MKNIFRVNWKKEKILTSQAKNELNGKRQHQTCIQCIMDTSDPEITFDDNGICNHCRDFSSTTSKQWFPNDEGKSRLEDIFNTIKTRGKDNSYDCIIGLSGGVDSSYIALKAIEWDLRPLIVHVDAGWNSELAVANIEKLLHFGNFDLHTLVVDWEDMAELHRAFLRSAIANQDAPQDHVFFAGLYHYAIKNDIQYVISGGNIATEGIFPKAWHGSAMDAINLKAIHQQYGEQPLRNYSTISFWKYYLWYPLIKKMRTVRPLNYMPYNKQAAIDELQKKVGWTAYDRKHGESLFTKVFQNYYLPEKHGFDKRRPHLSSLIVSGQISRSEALHELEKPLYDPDELEIDLNYFCKKLRITRFELSEMMELPNHHHSDFRNWESRHRLLKRIQRIAEIATQRKLRIYS